MVINFVEMLNNSKKVDHFCNFWSTSPPKIANFCKKIALYLRCTIAMILKNILRYHHYLAVILNNYSDNFDKFDWDFFLGFAGFSKSRITHVC